MLVLPFLAAAASLFSLSSAAPTPLANLALSFVDSSSDTANSFSLLNKRQTCSLTADCKNTPPSYANRYCKSGTCSWRCRSGYTQSGSRCVKDVSTSPSGSSTLSSGTTPTKVSLLAQSGVRSFTGTNTGAIASWYATNSGQDSTNGHSWCYYPYTDSVPGFAISLNTMLNDFNGDATAARQAYCGLEATVTTAAGKTVTLYVTDAFDDAWVRTPTSIDVIKNAFANLYGKSTSDKNAVLQNVSWKFTGNRSAKYSYASTGSG
ncbi:hypothetical protein JCM11641_008362 [Rhodosporidiobolus odoratus]